MKKGTRIFRWIVFASLATISLGALFSGGLGFIGAVFIALAALLAMPISFVSKLRQNLKLNRVITVILAVVLCAVGILFTPKNIPENAITQNTDSDSSATESQTTLPESSKPTESSKPAESSKPTEHTSSAHIHSYSGATCTEPAKCSCGATSGEALGHVFGNASCTEPAKCSRCGITSGSAKGHSWIAATYSAPKTCSVCKITEGDALPVPNSENYHGHVYTGGSSSKKYHYEPQCAGKNSHEITWDEVSRRNLEPCGTCVLK